MSEVTITHRAFAQRRVTSLVVDWAGADGLTDEEVCEAVFIATNTYSGGLWEAIQPLLPPNRTHTALSVGDEVTVRGTTYRCEGVGWSVVGTLFV